ncbi:mechanosensitive ion channel family protein [Halorussus halophilus]|uniref:mechanosensitive ion channel family protein n=1 Tax=Halorussus halophilus TaxID=2650975 RepID=UPI001CE47637|nr:mechanosensitive ion channel family protein [Halorussus halophilus]
MSLVALSVVASLMSLIDELAQFTTNSARVAISVVILFGVLVGVLAVRYVRREIRKRFTSNVADVILVSIIGTILLGAVVSLLVLWSKVDSAAEALEQIGGTLGVGVRILVALTTLAGAYILSGFAKRAIDRFSEGHEAISRHQSEIFYRVSQLSVYVAAVAVILGMWEVDLSGLLVGAGFLGIVVGMAARQTLGALLAGFVLMFSRPFEIGDWIQIDEEEGIVTDISIVNTRIQTFDGEYVMIPNDIVSGDKIVNKSRKGRLRIEVEVGVDYEADVEEAADIAEETMKELDEVLTVPTPKVVLKELGSSSVVLLLRAWIDKPSARRQWRARTAVIENVKSAYDEAGIKIPFPQRELTGREESGGLQVSGEQVGVESVDRNETRTDRAEEATADGGTDESDDSTEDAASDDDTEVNEE